MDTGNDARFELRKTQAGALMIRDNKDGTIVAHIHVGSKRRPEATQAMAEVMCAALNTAAAPKAGQNRQEAV